MSNAELIILRNIKNVRAGRVLRGDLAHRLLHSLDGVSREGPGSLLCPGHVACWWQAGPGPGSLFIISCALLFVYFLQVMYDDCRHRGSLVLSDKLVRELFWAQPMAGLDYVVGATEKMRPL